MINPTSVLHLYVMLVVVCNYKNAFSHNYYVSTILIYSV